MGTLYLLHFVPRLHHAGHYLGFTAYKDAAQRVRRHKQGRGANLTAAAVAAGCKLTLAAQAPGDRRRERQLKRNSHLWRWCPICCRDFRLRALPLTAPRPAAPPRRTNSTQSA